MLRMKRPSPRWWTDHHQARGIVLRGLDRPGHGFGRRVLARPDEIGDELAIVVVVHQAARGHALEDRMPLGPFVLEIQPADESGDSVPFLANGSHAVG